MKKLISNTLLAVIFTVGLSANVFAADVDLSVRDVRFTEGKFVSMEILRITVDGKIFLKKDISIEELKLGIKELAIANVKIRKDLDICESR